MRTPGICEVVTGQEVVEPEVTVIVSGGDNIWRSIVLVGPKLQLLSPRGHFISRVENYGSLKHGTQ